MTYTGMVGVNGTRVQQADLTRFFNNITDHQRGLVDALLFGTINPWSHYGPRGSQVDLLFSEEPEVLISGPAGTGKSRVCLEKLNWCATNYGGMRGLILRRTRESLTESALLTFERDVLGLGHPMLSGGPRRANRSSYFYPNGSEIIVAGIKSSGRDQTEKIMSTDYDLIYVQESVELSEDEWERCTTRLRSGVLPFQQLIADTNPSYPRHWLRQRCRGAGPTLMLQSRHEDNPLLWDAQACEWTPFGEEYIARLDRLTGVRKQRLRYGRWVQAEGVVYDEYNPEVHVIDPFPIPRDWQRYRCIDFGYTNPFVCQWWAEDGDGRLYLYREIYYSGRTVGVHSEAIKRAEGWYALRDVEANELVGELPDIPEIRGRCDEGEVIRADLGDGLREYEVVPGPYREEVAATICDHDAEDRATLSEAGIKSVKAIKPVSRGIQHVQERLAAGGDGKPRIFFFRGALIEEDLKLRKEGKPVCTVDEFDSYVWVGQGKEKPAKEDDHGMDATRYMVMHRDGKVSRSVYHGLVR